ncbi:hypothetical protein [Mesobacillus boroniphilus]|uniref:hypothetical protein n=1 Tax=Mesobacillus boroniphilus TaxID=308892 RepID=UPI000A7DC910|nr:hypothetical protein [Mesobacillus boroniphilus]
MEVKIQQPVEQQVSDTIMVEPTKKEKYKKIKKDNHFSKVFAGDGASRCSVDVHL